MKPTAFHTSVRFGLSPKNSELKYIGTDPKGWLFSQLDNPTTPPEIKKRYLDNGIIGYSFKNLRRENQNNNNNTENIARKIYVYETTQRALAHIRSEQPFIERLVAFWSNHFTVSIKKNPLAGIVNEYEATAIRPYVNGYFKDMLVAVCSHPAMLFYLDNMNSMGGNSFFGQKRKKGGLNENLTREIMELHTLGVGGGYSQNDVIELAKIITGWSLKRTPPDGLLIEYIFNPRMHETGDKTLLGKKISENGEQEGIDALTMLAHHPATARHIATKLARHFISDTPPISAIDALSKTFLDTKGHLPSVIKTLIHLDETWAYPLAKLKTPYEFMISALRLTGFEPPEQQIIRSLVALNYRVFNASSPAGFDDIAEAWSAPDSIMKRIEWGHKLARRLPKNIIPMQLAQTGLAENLSPMTQQIIEQAPSGIDSIALLLASPEFQRR
jgi:uncharacterized protein (DUF1800 family)